MSRKTYWEEGSNGFRVLDTVEGMIFSLKAK
jgi:hypothetical protein